MLPAKANAGTAKPQQNSAEIPHRGMTPALIPEACWCCGSSSPSSQNGPKGPLGNWGKGQKPAGQRTFQKLWVQLETKKNLAVGSRSFPPGGVAPNQPIVHRRSVGQLRATLHGRRGRQRKEPREGVPHQEVQVQQEDLLKVLRVSCHFSLSLFYFFFGGGAFAFWLCLWLLVIFLFFFCLLLLLLFCCFCYFSVFPGSGRDFVAGRTSESSKGKSMSRKSQSPKIQPKSQKGKDQWVNWQCGFSVPDGTVSQRVCAPFRSPSRARGQEPRERDSHARHLKVRQ